MKPYIVINMIKKISKKWLPWAGIKRYETPFLLKYTLEWKYERTIKIMTSVDREK